MIEGNLSNKAGNISTLLDKLKGRKNILGLYTSVSEIPSFISYGATFGWQAPSR